MSTIQQSSISSLSIPFHDELIYNDVRLLHPIGPNEDIQATNFFTITYDKENRHFCLQLDETIRKCELVYEDIILDNLSEGEAEHFLGNLQKSLEKKFLIEDWRKRPPPFFIYPDDLDISCQICLKIKKYLPQNF